MGRNLHWSIIAASQSARRGALGFLRKPSEHIRTAVKITEAQFKQDASAGGRGSWTAC
jgi:hypothetical protein